MPASRRARAMTLAPRSWPSRPGLATSTRMGYPSGLDNRGLRVSAEHGAQRIADLAQGAIGLYRIQDERHGVRGTFGGTAQVVQRTGDSLAAPAGAEVAKLSRLVILSTAIDLENLDGILARRDEAVHTDDDLALLFDRLLIGVA